MNRRLRIILLLIGALLVAALLRGCVATSYRIPCAGMEDSLYSGDRILVNRWSYGLRFPLMALWGYHRWRTRPVLKRDLIVFNDPADRSASLISRREVYMGRCLAAAGDTLWVDSTFLPAQADTLSYPLVIPARGHSVEVHPWNRVLLCNTLLLHERRAAEIRHDTLFVDGKPVNRCRFTKDYCWVGSENAVNPGDSRLFGFVPQDHLIGKATSIWLSIDDKRGWFNGHIRWKRMFRSIR